MAVPVMAEEMVQALMTHHQAELLAEQDNAA